MQLLFCYSEAMKEFKFKVAFLNYIEIPFNVGVFGYFKLNVVHFFKFLFVFFKGISIALKDLFISLQTHSGVYHSTFYFFVNQHGKSDTIVSDQFSTSCNRDIKQ